MTGLFLITGGCTKTASPLCRTIHERVRLTLLATIGKYFTPINKSFHRDGYKLLGHSNTVALRSRHIYITITNLP